MRDRSFRRTAEWQAYEEGSGPKPDSAESLGRHERKCTVCNHPDRDVIEQEFLRWYVPADIARDHDIPYASAIYRHAHATGLFERRHHTIRVALEPLIEQATHVEATADSTIRAVRAYAHLDSAGKWKSRQAKPARARRSRSPRKRRNARAPKHARQASRKQNENPNREI